MNAPGASQCGFIPDGNAFAYPSRGGDLRGMTRKVLGTFPKWLLQPTIAARAVNVEDVRQFVYDDGIPAESL